MASAQSAKFSATLSGGNAAPAVDTAAQGTATFQLSANGRSLRYRISVVNLENATMAHIHLGAAGENGPIAVWLYPAHPPASLKAGKFTGVLASGTITAANLAGSLKGKTIADLVHEIKSGNAYVNVHTKAHPGGEIRGQIH
ncbi:MAG TPA: CHRD domain-containing protein [Terriglobales bacterium]|nr:CHRD domain-containing protein [Terriglobales bacterium]